MSQGRMYNSDDDDDDDIQGTTPFAFLPSLPFKPTHPAMERAATYVRTYETGWSKKKGEKEVEVEEEGLLKRRGLSFLHFLVGKGNRRRYCERKTFLFFSPSSLRPVVGRRSVRRFCLLLYIFIYTCAHRVSVHTHTHSHRKKYICI